MVKKKYVPAIDAYFSRLLDKSPDLSPDERRRLACYLYDNLQDLISLVDSLHKIYDFPELAELQQRVKNRELSPKLVASPYFVKDVKSLLMKYDIDEDLKRRGILLCDEILATADILIMYNLRLVRNILTSMLYTSPERADEKVMSEGIWAAIHAIYSYNPYKGTEMSTYIAWWIKSIVGEVLDRRKFSQAAPEPFWVRKPAAAFGKVPFRKIMALKRFPTVEELEKITGVNITSFFSSMYEKTDKVSLFDRNVIDEEVEKTLHDDTDVEMEFISDDLREKLYECLEMLPEDERNIISLYYGLNGPSLPLRSVATRIKRSYEYTRKKLISAQEKLKRCLSE